VDAEKECEQLQQHRREGGVPAGEDATAKRAPDRRHKQYVDPLAAGEIARQWPLSVVVSDI